MITLAQLGCGYWGPNLVRNSVSSTQGSLKWVIDPNPKRQAYVASNYPSVRVSGDPSHAFGDPHVDGILIATPAATHFALAKAALSANKHVLVEKPLAMSVKEVDELSRLASSRKRVLMAGHTFIYNNAVRFVKNALDKEVLGKLYYIYSQRLNLGQVRSDVNAWWNLAPHDISIMLYLLDEKRPFSISVRGKACLQKGIEDVVFAVLEWKGGVLVELQMSWLDPGKVRKITLVGSRKMMVYDDISDNKITILDKGVDRVPVLGERMDFDFASQVQFIHRAGSISQPRVEWQEPLKTEIEHFLTCIRKGLPPLTGAGHARNVVAILQAGQQSLRAGGRPVKIGKS